MTIGQNIKEQRRKKQLTQEELAQLLGVTRQAVTRWENDTVEPSTENLIALSNIFECQLDDLVFKRESKVSKVNTYSCLKNSIILEILLGLFTLILYFVLVAFDYPYSMTIYIVVLTTIYLLVIILTLLLDKNRDKFLVRALLIIPLVILFILILIGLKVEL